MAGERCGRHCAWCGRCDAPWDAEPDELEELPDADFHEAMREATEEMIRRAATEEIFLRGVAEWFRKTDAA